jgi:hypothetical protein
MIKTTPLNFYIETRFKILSTILFKKTKIDPNRSESMKQTGWMWVLFTKVQFNCYYNLNTISTFYGGPKR